MGPESLAEHLISLPGETAGRWALWRTVCLRGAGFPADQILKLADRECAAAADDLIGTEDEASRLREAALQALYSELQSAGKDRVDRLVKTIRRIKRGQPVSAEGLAAKTAVAIEVSQEAAERVRAAKERYEAASEAAENRLHEVLCEHVQDERFREAMVWQNRQAVERALGSFLRRPTGNGRGSARDRGNVQMLVSYLQRYCTKNDSIGFFGPIGWGRLSESAETITVQPGRELLASRQVFFEGWAIDAIAERLTEDEAMRPWLAPRRTPFLRREGNAFVAPDGRRIELDPLPGALLASCDGTRPARELIRQLTPDLSADQEAGLLHLLADLHAKGLLRWGFQIPLSSTPERTFRELLQKIGEEPLRERALAVLDEIERRRDAVVRAAGRADQLGCALNELETTFTRVTGRPASRASGGTYSGRTLVYEDCRRELELEMGAPFLAELAAPLSLVLASARWYCHYLEAGMRELFTEVYRELRPQGGSEPVDLLTFSQIALPRLLSTETAEARRAEINARWAKVLAIPQGQRRLTYRSEDLRPHVLREFAAPGPGWQSARCHSPDLLIAASSIEAIRQGDYQIVLGEVHLALNTLDRNLFFSVHPHPEQLNAAMEADMPEPLLFLSLPKIWNQEMASSRLGMPSPASTSRMSFASRSAKDFYLDFSLDPPGVPTGQVLAIGDLLLEPMDGSFVVKPRDGRVCFKVGDFFRHMLLLQVLNTFQVMPAGPYTPRVAIDRLVVIRESWRFRAGELDFAQEPTPEARFVAARRWAGRLGLPRFLFVKAAGERKPTYLDLESPVLVELFSKAVRKAAGIAADAAIRVSEMLPEYDRLWLPDAQGNLYTCELRTVALELQ